MHVCTRLCKLAKVLCVFNSLFIKSSFLDYAGLRVNVVTSIVTVTNYIVNIGFTSFYLSCHLINEMSQVDFSSNGINLY